MKKLLRMSDKIYGLFENNDTLMSAMMLINNSYIFECEYM